MLLHIAMVTAVLAPAQPQLSYVLTVTPEAGPTSGVTLECKPSGGSHPYKTKACKQLLKAGGRVEDIPPKDGVCPADYAPVTVRAEGTDYLYERTFSNLCTAILQTGGYLFKFKSA